MLEWLRSYVRRRMPYVEPQQARAINARLSLIYAVLGWNIVGLSIYWMFKHHVPRTPQDSVDYAKLLGVHDATVIKYSGFNKVKEYDIHLEDKDLEEYYAEQEQSKEKKPSQDENTMLVE